jgi:hypothetical protein
VIEKKFIEGFENEALTLNGFNLKYDADIVLLPEVIFALGVENGQYDTLFTFVKEEETMIEYWMKYIHPSLPSKYYVLMCPMNFFDDSVIDELSVRPASPDSQEMGTLVVSSEFSAYPGLPPKRKVYALCKNIRDRTTVLLPDIDFIREHAYEKQLKEVDKNAVDYTEKYNHCIWVGDLRHVSELDPLIDSRPLFQKLYEEGKMTNVEVKRYLKVADQIQYKLLLDMDERSSIQSTTIWKLYSGSVVLKTKSNWKQWYYDDLIEWVHYVPIQSDFSDLPQKIEWCLQHEEECKEIVKNARDFVLGTLNWEEVQKYSVETVLNSFRSYG